MFSDWVNEHNAAAANELIGLYDESDGPGDDNELAVYLGVECTDTSWPTNWNVWSRDNWAIFSYAPFETWGNAWFNAPCIYWPAARSRPVSINGSGVHSALLIDETLDAATPFEGSLEVRRLFPHSVLLAEPGGTTHAETPDGDLCVDGTIAAYLATGALPARNNRAPWDKTCPPPPVPVPAGASSAAIARGSAGSARLKPRIAGNGQSSQPLMRLGLPAVELARGRLSGESGADPDRMADRCPDSGAHGLAYSGSVAAITPDADRSPNAARVSSGPAGSSCSAAARSSSIRASAGPAAPGSGSRQAARACAMNGQAAAEVGRRAGADRGRERHQQVAVDADEPAADPAHLRYAGRLRSGWRPPLEDVGHRRTGERSPLRVVEPGVRADPHERVHRADRPSIREHRRRTRSAPPGRGRTARAGRTPRTSRCRRPRWDDRPASTRTSPGRRSRRGPARARPRDGAARDRRANPSAACPARRGPGSARSPPGQPSRWRPPRRRRTRTPAPADGA